MHPTDQVHGCRVDDSGFPSQKLHGAQRPQWILHESLRVGGPKNPVLQVGNPAERVDDLARGQVVGQRVYREVPPHSRLLRRHTRVQGYLKTGVTNTDLVVSAGYRDVDVQPLHAGGTELEDTEGEPDLPRLEGGQSRLNVEDVEAVDLDVPILWLPAEERIDDTAADEHGFASCLGEGGNDSGYCCWDVNHGSS